MPDSVSVTKEISAPADEVWALISDVTRMGDWSPETESCAWSGGATGPSVGARFSGKNRNGKKRWSTGAKVVAAEPGRSFAFDVAVGPFGVARWAYDIEPTEHGCRVTETWTDHRNALTKVVSAPISGVSDRHEHNRASMETTLENLAAAAEQR